MPDAPPGVPGTARTPVRLRRTLAELIDLLRRDADRRVRLQLLAALLLVGGSGLLAALAPVALKALVDAVAGHTDGGDHGPWHLVALGSAYVLALCGSRALADLGPRHTGIADQRLDRRLTDRFVGHLLHQSMASLLRRRAGELLRSLDMASAACRVVVLQLVNSVVPALVEALVMAVVLLKLGQPALVAAFAVTAALYAAVFVTGARRLAPMAGRVSAAHLALHAQLAENLQHVETLRCLGAEAQARQGVDAAGEVLEDRWEHLHRMRACIALVVTAVFALSVAASLLLAADAVARGTLSMGGFVLANVYMLQLARPLEMLGAATRDIAQSLGFVRPLLDILAEPVEQQGVAPTPPAQPDRRSPGRSPALRFERLWFGHDPQRPVIRGLDLDIPAGSTVAIVGASGSGKSTLVRLLLRLCEPQGGCILLDGQPIHTLPRTELRARIGLVPQDTALFHDSIASNIRLGRPGATMGEIATAAAQAQLQALVAALPDGCDTTVGERGLQLSGGERQRVAIARALLRQPDVYVLDEATSMLDSRTEAAFLSGFRRLSAGRTTLLIAHRLSTVTHADCIVVLDHGRVAEQGRHDELLQRGGLYARLWAQQTRGR